LDDKELATGLTADQFSFVSAIAAAHPEPIPFRKIAKGNCKGKNATRIRDSLPARLRKIIMGAKQGYRLDLPAAERHT
jgi:hypothetical protein